MSPLRGRVPTRLRNGLEISPGSNQASLSGRSLSCSLDELGLKYLNHRGQRAKPFDIDDRLLKTSTTPENKERKWPLSSSPTSPCTVKHFPHKWAHLVSIFDYQHLSQMKAKVLLHLCFECVGLPIAWGSGDAVQQHKQHEKKHRHPEVIHAVSVITCKHNRSYICLLWFRENQWDVW